MIIDSLPNDKRIESPNRDKKKKQINAFDTEITMFQLGSLLSTKSNGIFYPIKADILHYNRCKIELF